MISSMVFFVPMNSGKIKSDSRRNEFFWKTSGIKTNNRKIKLDAIVLVQRNMRENMNVGVFKLAATLYYT